MPKPHRHRAPKSAHRRRALDLLAPSREGLGLFLTAGVMSVLMGTVGAIAAAEQSRQPILIPGIQEPEEMRVEPLQSKKVEPPAPLRQLAEATNNFSNKNLPEWLPVLDRILAKYPDFAEGYVFRIGALCEINDRRRVISDINSALKFKDSSQSIKDGLVGWLSMQAKLAYADGDYVGAMDGLDKAIRVDLEKAKKFTNSGAATPEKTASSVCIWTEPDMDALVQRFPNDYRSHMFRGLYFSFFVNFSSEDWIITRAIESFNKAAQLNPKSALPQLFKAELLGHHFVFYKRLRQRRWDDAERDKLNAELVDEYSKALALDPNLLAALKGRASAFFSLKQFQKAIADYDRILSLDLQDWISYQDRGLAKMQLGRDYDAISDFNATIELKPRERQHTSYESRADAYVKTRQLDAAIRDLTTAISLEIGSSVLLINISQFRALYPEYKAASNEAITRKLHQTFYPDLTYEGFSEKFLTQRAMGSTVIPDLYLKRSDAYLKKGNWHLASVDFRRAINGFPDYADAVDRWREIGQSDRRTYIDMKTFDDAHNDSIKIWIKQFRGASSDDGPHQLLQFELNCRARQIRPLSLANYDASGSLVGSREGGRWASIIPDTIGETLYIGACRAN
jgi:tetratricopeptide (TPR) repeat protein